LRSFSIQTKKPFKKGARNPHLGNTSHDGGIQGLWLVAIYDNEIGWAIMRKTAAEEKQSEACE
jgi:hypothetical protein